MCKVYNTIGSLKIVKAHLDKNKIDDFKSLNEVIEFRKTYASIHSNIIYEHKKLIDKEESQLPVVIKQLDETIEGRKQEVLNQLNDEIENIKTLLSSSIAFLPSNGFQKLTNHLKQWYYKTKIYYKKRTLESNVKKSLKTMIRLRDDKSKRYQFISTHFDDAVMQSCKIPLTELERKKRIVDEVSTYIYGALGEQQVVKKLESLSDEYSLINDFSISFSKPIYNSQGKDYIKSVQIDHLLIGPSGIFLIETKNWNAESLENLSLFSPVKQIKRTSFAIFKLLNNEISNYHLRLDKHHWGEKKIPIRNLIVMIQTKPKEEFQFVKVLGINELLNYIKYFQPVFSNAETEKIADFLVNINSR